MKMRFRRDRADAGGRPPQGKPLVDRLRAGAAVLAISVAGCSFNSGGIPIPDGSLDTGADTIVVDMRKNPDIRKIPDKGISDAKANDHGPDAAPDMPIADLNQPDFADDKGTETGADSGAVCPGVKNETAYGKAAYVGTPVTVGGYDITNTGAVPGGVNVDINCGSSGSGIKSAVFLAKGGAEAIVQVAADGKRIRLKNISSGSTVANLNILVETL